MHTIFRALLGLYPRRDRDLLGEEMKAVFEEGMREHRDLGRAAYLRFLLSEARGLVLGAIKARFAGRAPIQVARVTVSDLPEEVLQAESRVAFNLNRLQFAISRHQFVQARFYSEEERKARHDLRRMREKYGLGE
jgi:hypothetical protein